MELKGKHTEVGIVTNLGETEEETELFAALKSTVSIDPDEQVTESDYFGEELTQTTVYGGNPTISFEPDADDAFSNLDLAGVTDADGNYSFSERDVEALRVLNYADGEAADPVAAVQAVDGVFAWEGVDFNEDGDVEGELVFHVNGRLEINPDDIAYAGGA